MKIGVVGLWHLGVVTSACLADVGYDVIGYDNDLNIINNLNRVCPPIFEPGLDNLIGRHIGSKLTFTQSIVDLASCDLFWVTFDTPVDENDLANTALTENYISELFPIISANKVVIISSQLPVGSVSRIRENYQKKYSEVVHFCYVPENLRLGNAIQVFNHPDRVIIGLSSEEPKLLLKELFTNFTNNIVWMSVESAEMTKHAINAFLANSIVFINELAIICEKVGAKISEVEVGLKSEARIGPKAYLRAGSAFAGGTLARDINFLIDKSIKYSIPSHLIRSIAKSNGAHEYWVNNKLLDIYGDHLTGLKVCILGLAYKAGTSTLRRSSSVKLCTWLNSKGANVTAYDPHINSVDIDFINFVTLASDIESAVMLADVIIICNNCPEFTSLSSINAFEQSRAKILLDPSNYFSNVLLNKKIRRISIGNTNE